MLRGDGTKRISRRKNKKTGPTRQRELASRRRKLKNSTLWQIQQARKKQSSTQPEATTVS